MRATSVVLASLFASGCATGKSTSEPDASVRDPGPSIDAAPPADAAPPDAAVAPCVEGNVNMVDPATGNCYMLFTAAASYNQATSSCTGNDSHLVTIFSAAENTFVRGLTTGEFWIGATDRAAEGNFVWATGETMASTFDNWDGGEPNNSGGEDCAQMRDDNTWNDTVCNNNQRYVCERP